MTEVPERYRPQHEPFGRWLIAQRDRGDWIDAIADAARRDPAFPKEGGPDDLHCALLLPS